MQKYSLPSILLITLAVSFFSQAKAKTFSDDFNRDANVSMTPLGSSIGPYWNLSDGYWTVINTSKDGILRINAAENTSNNQIVWNTSLELEQINGKRSAAQIDALASKPNTWVGLAFNIQDENSFYQFRYKAGTNHYQIVKHDNGKIKSILNGNNAQIEFQPNTFYRLTVYLGVDGSDDYMMTITPVDKPKDILNPKRTFSDSSFKNGYAGATFGNWKAGYSFDNFFVETSD